MASTIFARSVYKICQSRIHAYSKLHITGVNDYITKRDAMHKEPIIKDMGKEQTYLPASVRNSPRSCYRALQNAMTIVQQMGKPG